MVDCIGNGWLGLDGPLQCTTLPPLPKQLYNRHVPFDLTQGTKQASFHRSSRVGRLSALGLKSCSVVCVEYSSCLDCIRTSSLSYLDATCASVIPHLPRASVRQSQDLLDLQSRSALVLKKSNKS